MRWEVLLLLLLSTIAGLVDVISFLTLKIFAAHVTGNLVLIAALLVGGRKPNPDQDLAVPVFIPPISSLHEPQRINVYSRCHDGNISNGMSGRPFAHHHAQRTFDRSNDRQFEHVHPCSARHHGERTAGRRCMATPEEAIYLALGLLCRVRRGWCGSFMVRRLGLVPPCPSGSSCGRIDTETITQVCFTSGCQGLKK